MSIIDELWDTGIKGIPAEREEDLIVKGLWDIDIFFQPQPNEIKFVLNYLITQTEFQGCAWYDAGSYNRKSFPSIVGQHYSFAKNQPLPIKIAVLDSIFAFQRRSLHPTRKYVKEGTPSEKALWRAEVIGKEVSIWNAKLAKRNTPRVMLIGFSGLILDQLLSIGCVVAPYDLEPELIGREIRPSVIIKDGKNLYQDLDQADIMVMTGMTLVTSTTDAIIQEAKKSGIPIIIYAETGANIAPFLLNYGIASAICEYIPIYNMEGRSNIWVFRK